MNSITRNIAFLSILILFGCTKDDFTWNVKKLPCVITFYNSSEDFFTQVSMAGMTNNTLGTGPNNFYKDKIIKVKKGQAYDLLVNFQTTSPAVGVYAYFDWNGDGDFLDSDESTLVSSNINFTNVTKSITVPSNAVAGEYFARFIVRAGSTISSDPCFESDSYGEVEDYPLVIE
jgi:hypothetical protein